MKIIVFGATGLVGRTMLKVLEEKAVSGIFQDIELVAVASERSVGRPVSFLRREIEVISAEAALSSGAQIALFSAGAEASKEWAPHFAEKGIYVIDNSSAWRKRDDVPLVVPEINGHTVSKSNYLVSNPNCSTIQLVAALAPLHQKYTLDRIIISTYQSVTGSGIAGLQQLMDERNGIAGPKAYPHPIDLNLIPQGGHFMEDGYTSEEEKLLFETRKILGSQDIRISATVVRVPVKGGHSEAVNVSFKQPYQINDVINLLKNTAGIILMDDVKNAVYPTPLLAEGRDEVFVGRLRRDTSAENALNMWIVADNLRKGAATNAVQIAEYMMSKVI